ncbi:MAG: PDZ domain-containing protein [Streptosporangiales bacterium]|nr:PDZ domain-containing protein [Streptosporangiales bacterium]
MSRLGRRVVNAGAFGIAILLAYTAGIVTGATGGDDDATAHERSGVVDEAAQRIVHDSARPADRAMLDAAAVNGMLDVLGDQWARYTPASRFAAAQTGAEGRYSGVGVWLRATGGHVEVSSVKPGSPAERAGLRPGDVLVAVAGSAPRGAAAAATALRGTSGSAVVTTVRRAGREHTVRLTRTGLGGDVTTRRDDGGALRVRVEEFGEGVGERVRAAVADRPSGGVLLDLRDNEGGLLDEAVTTASAFLDGGRVAGIQRRGEARGWLTAEPGGDRHVPVVVLVNGGTASAAELVAAALQDRERAVVVGSRTFGKGAIQEERRLSDGSALKLTVGRYLDPSGRSIDGVGVRPDVLVASDKAPAVAERRAVKVLSGLRTTNARALSMRDGSP